MHNLLLNPGNKGAMRYSAVCKWTRQGHLLKSGQARHAEGVLSCSLIIAPVNLGNRHWVLVVADLDKRRILWLDPAGTVSLVKQLHIIALAACVST